MRKDLPLSNKTLEQIKSVLLIDNNEIDNFVNRKIFERYGVSDIKVFKFANNALSYLEETKAIYQLILIEIHLPIVNGFEFVERFKSLGLEKVHGEIYFLSASLNPLDKIMAEKKNIQYIEKPFTIDKLLSNAI